jgi:hypothetical protein
MHNLGRIDLADLESTGRYRSWASYGSAKLMNILHAAELNRRFQNVHGVSFHPGLVATGFAREGSSVVKLIYNTSVGKRFMVEPEKGADTLVWLATSKRGTDWRPGEYYIRRKPARKSPLASDAILAQKLWDQSARTVGMA